MIVAAEDTKSVADVVLLGREIGGQAKPMINIRFLDCVHFMRFQQAKCSHKSFPLSTFLWLWGQAYESK